MYLFFDTETTGLPKNYNAPLTKSDNWPRLVQIAWIIMDDAGLEIETHESIIKPEDFNIPYQATKIHGITTEQANIEGVLLETELYKFATAIDKIGILVAHNFDFDSKIIGAEFIRKKILNHLFDKSYICTMKSTTNFCRLSGRYGYKWPTLSELHQKVFGVEFKEAHNAMVDVQACTRCFFQLKKLGVL
jgi:DNA polymerase III subunit epsilon